MYIETHKEYYLLYIYTQEYYLFYIYVYSRDSKVSNFSIHEITFQFIVMFRVQDSVPWTHMKYIQSLMSV